MTNDNGKQEATDEFVGKNNLSYKSPFGCIAEIQLLCLIYSASMFLFKAVNFQIETSLLIKLIGF